MSRPVRRRAAAPALMALAAATTAALLLAGPAATTATATPTPSPRASTTRPAGPTLPVPRATVDPDLAVGGPRLAAMGVITDLPPGVPAPPVMNDVAWLVADMDTGEVLAAKAPHARLLPASTLKTLTAALLLPTIDRTRTYTADDSDAGVDGTRIGLVPGLTYTGEQLFEALLMGSANDAAHLLARVNGGVPQTLAQMNALAARLGALDTVARDPSGLDAPGQSSSAYDLALIGRYAMENPQFRRLVTTRQVAFPGRWTVDPKTTKKTRATYQLANHNTLLHNYPGTIGVKNGWTSKAERTFIAAATRGGRTYLVTEMYGLDTQQWRPTAALLDWAFAHGRSVRPVGRLVRPGEPLPTRATAAPTTAPGVPESPGGAAGGAAALATAGRAQPGAASAHATVVPRWQAAVAGGAGLAGAALLVVLLARRRRRYTSRH